MQDAAQPPGAIGADPRLTAIDITAHHHFAGRRTDAEAFDPAGPMLREAEVAVAARVDDVARGYWHPVAYSSQVGPNPLAVTVMGEALVIARLDSGDVFVAPDRCPHRGAPLSMGAVGQTPSGESCLVCPYHGLHFARTGQAVHYPARPDSRLPGRLNLEVTLSEEKHGLVWVCLSGDPVAPIPDWSRVNDANLGSFELGPHVWNVTPARIVENFNDLAHFATVHAETFGAADRPEVPEISLVETGVGFDHEARMTQLDRVTMDGPLVPVEIGFRYVHEFPFCTELQLTYGPDRVEWIQVATTPVSPTETMVFQRNFRTFDLDGDDPAAGIAAWREFQWVVNLEDRRLMEAVRPRWASPDGQRVDEVALGTDTFAVAYRRRWATVLGP